MVWRKINVGASGVLMIWGRVFEDRGEVYIQSFARFAIRNSPENLAVDAGGARYTGVFSAQEVAFAVRLVRVSDLQRVALDYESYGTLRTSPSDSAKGEPLTPGIGRCIDCGDVTASAPRHSFVVEAQRGEWAHVKTINGSEEGWLRIGAPFQGRPLSAFLPELNLEKAIISYMEARQFVIKTDPTSLEELASRYAEHGGNGLRGAEVLGWELAGFQWAQKRSAEGSCTKAKRDFQRALI